MLPKKILNYTISWRYFWVIPAKDFIDHLYILQCWKSSPGRLQFRRDWRSNCGTRWEAADREGLLQLRGLQRISSPHKLFFRLAVKQPFFNELYSFLQYFNFNSKIVYRNSHRNPWVIFVECMLQNAWGGLRYLDDLRPQFPQFVVTS